jgi:IclR family transcriptional regulator, pca regulon regulatory protein
VARATTGEEAELVASPKDSSAPVERDEESGRSELITGFSRGLAVIRSFANATAPMSIADVAKAVGLNRSTARRFLRTLEAEGYVAAENGRYSLQPRILELGYAYLASVPVDEAMRRCLFQAAEKAQESCIAAVLDGPHVVIVARAQRTFPRVMTLALTTGTRIRAHLTAVGRVLLAELPERELEEYLRAVDFHKETTTTIAGPDELRRELARIRDDGYSIVDQEIELGVRACALLVPRHSHPSMAVSISSSATRGTVETVRRDHLPVLRELRDNLTAILNTGA